MPTVSVLIPNYNRPRLLQDALRSVLAQTYQDFEILVVDDGSTEDIPSAIRPFGDRVRYLHKENGGATRAKNYGLSHITGEYVAFLDNDDLWLPRKLERQVDILKHQPQVAMVSCQVYLMDDKGRVLARPPQGSERRTPQIGLSELTERNAVVGGCSSQMVRVAALQEVRGFDPMISFVEDWDCWLRLARRWQIWMIPEPLSYYRINSQGYRNHAPLPDLVDAVHRNVLRMLRQAFENWPGGQEQAIRGRAYAREYLRHALVLYANDRAAEGRLTWETAIDYDAEVGARSDSVLPSIKDCITGYTLGIREAERVARTDRILASTLSALPEPVRYLKQHLASLKASIMAELAFLAAQEGSPAEARRLAWRCLTLDPSWAHNIGLLKLITTGGRRHWPVPVQEHMAGHSSA